TRTSAAVLWQHDRLEVEPLTAKAEAFVERHRGAVEVVDVQRQGRVALEGQGAAGTHRLGAEAAAAELAGDVDPLDLGAVLAGAANVHLEHQLAVGVFNVGPVPWGDDRDSGG